LKLIVDVGQLTAASNFPVLSRLQGKASGTQMQWPALFNNFE
jgi:hypothetical protein